ncbi:hypothetical protein SAMN05660206_10164 [Sphingobacterium wenxiniae]|uniref:Uncharacterized protein n=1 Tax=Sphingobacterium wenxiniae TaxID=683125 RepID=A0A1I6NSC1_9SPHI|nr:hypothetical protein SAMN05660206_10164 [Sphingobacterium wenxiniae]
MSKRFKKYMAFILLLLLQIIGSADLYTALCFSSISTSATETHLHAPHSQQHLTSQHTVYKLSSPLFHKNISEIIQDSDIDLSGKLSYAKVTLILVVGFLLCAYELCLRNRILSGFCENNPIYSSCRYILYSNFRI